MSSTVNSEVCAEDCESKQRVLSSRDKWQRRGLKNTLAAVGLSAGVLISGLSHAGPRYDHAKVIDVQPTYESVRFEMPVEQCHEERVRVEPRRRSATAPLLGAVIGGAIGNAVGHKKRNKQVGTVVGALLGGSIGADIGRHHRHHRDHRSGREAAYRVEQVCETTYQSRHENRLTGYNVRYQYAGTTYQTHMDHDPGEYLRVSVRVRPVGG